MKFTTAIFLTFLSISTLAQSTKKRIRQSEELIQNGRISEALLNIESVLMEDSSNTEALKLKVGILIKQNKVDDASVIFQHWQSKFEADKDIHFLLSYYSFKKDNVSIQKKYHEENRKKFTQDNYDIFLQSFIETKQLDSALICAQKCIDQFGDNNISYYYKGLCQELTKNYSQAISSYQKAVYFTDRNDKNIQNIHKIQKGLARCCVEVSAWSNAQEWCDKSLLLFPDDFEMNHTKAIILWKMNLLTEAVLFLKRAHELKPEDNQIIHDLFILNKLLNKNDEALQWIQMLCRLDKNNSEYQLEKAKLLLETKEYESAYSELMLLKEKKHQLTEVEKLISAAKIDTEAPKITFITQLADTIYSGDIINNQEISIEVKDHSVLKQVMIGNYKIDIAKDTLLRVSRSIDISKYDYIHIIAIDVFDNICDRKIIVVRDTIKPQLKIVFPTILSNTIIPENASDKEIFLELSATDNFSVLGLVINGNTKTVKTNKQIRFFDKINIENTDSIIIEVTDIYSNKSYRRIFIDRKKAEENAANPMGRTFVLLITNYAYKNLKELSGPLNDAAQLKASLSKYAIDSIIQVENFSQQDFKKMFEKDIHQMINNYNIKSLIIWYSGHGKYSEYHNTGYWLPVESIAEDYDNYFSLREMKISLSGIKRLKHLLVISDACETGKSFYTQKISRNSENTCSDWTLTKMSSVECFTSSDGELSSDNSLFAKTFSNVLNNNPAPCISIGSVAEKVKEIVETYQAQKPVFGHITGMDDENGSFIFLKR
jgi:tetratricopeptide (TPR) repeat protein